MRIEDSDGKSNEACVPIMKDEVKALYKEGHREGGGSLSRQTGESMKH